MSKTPDHRPDHRPEHLSAASDELQTSDVEAREADSGAGPKDLSQGKGTGRARALRKAKAPRKKWWILRHIFLSLASFLFFSAVVCGLLVLSLTEREVVIPHALAAKLETRLNQEIGDLKISVGQLVLRVDKNFIPRVRARNVGLIDTSGSEVMRVNSMRAVMSLEALKARHFAPDTLEVSGAQFVLRRRVDGSFVIEFGGSGTQFTSLEDVPKSVVAAFETGLMSHVEKIGLQDVTISIEDARSGRVWLATDIAATLKHSANAVEISFDSEVFNGTADLAQLQAGLTFDKTTLETEISLNVTDAAALDVAQQSPALSFLSVLDAPISAAMRAQISGDAHLKSYSGTLNIGAGTLAPEQGARPLAFEGASGYFTYDPKKQRLTFPDLNLQAETLNLSGSGHVLLTDFKDKFPQIFTGQFALDHLAADVEELFPEPLSFETGSLDLQLKLDPFQVKIGSMVLQNGDLWVRSSGQASARADGWSVALDSTVDRLDVDKLMGLWPASVIPKTRSWLNDNITAGQFQDLRFSLRSEPENLAPEVHLDWVFDEAQVRFLKTLPPIVEGAGYGIIHDDNLTVVVQEGKINAPSGGSIDVAGSVVEIPNLSVKPVQLTASLKTQSSVQAAVALLDEKPFNVLKNAKFGPDVAQGHAALTGRVRVPLVKQIQLEDVAFDVTGDLTQVVSSTLMPGQTLRSNQLSLGVTGEGIRIAGPVSIGTAQGNAAWSKAFGLEHAGISDISGSVTINQALLDTFGVGLPKGAVSGATQGDLTVALRKGQAPAFRVASRLEGLGLSIPALGVSKAKSQRGRFSIAGQAGATPSISDLSLTAAGLSASGGRVRLNSNGTLDQLSFETLKVGQWLQTSPTLIGQGRGVPVQIKLQGGTVDLRSAPFAKGGSSGSNASASPLDVALDRLIVTDGFALHGASAQLKQNGGLSGVFKGRLNGGAAITGRIAPGKYGSDFEIKAKNGGRAIVSAGLLEEADGGTLAVALKAREVAGTFDGSARLSGARIMSAPKLAELLSLISVVGLIEQLAGPGIFFNAIESTFTILPDRINIGPSSAQGPSLGVSAEGTYFTGSKSLDIQGVVSPFYFLNAVGQIVSKKGEGLFGFNFGLQGPVASPKVSVNPLSLLTPGALRGIFRKAKP
jgi:hypothetical protein